jgi:hypothetical protein
MTFYSVNMIIITNSHNLPFLILGIYRVAEGLEKCQQEFYYCMENSAIDAATSTVFESPDEK